MKIFDEGVVTDSSTQEQIRYIHPLQIIIIFELMGSRIIEIATVIS
jgi:hypothetical protein